MSVRIHVASDLHADLYHKVWGEQDLTQLGPIYNPPECDLVLFGGDVANGVGWSSWYLKKLYGNRPMFWVPGNHDYYGAVYSAAVKHWQADETCIHHRVVTLEINGVPIQVMGATLWTDFELDPVHSAQARIAAFGGMNDFREIRKNAFEFAKVEDWEKWHRLDLDFIRRNLDKPFDGVRVVMTHHLPSPLSISYRYANHPLNGAFASNLNQMIGEYQPDLWVHGHTHTSCDYYYGNTQVVCNPRGYDFGNGPENQSWNPNFLVYM